MLLILLVALLLSGCGGGSSSNSPSPSPVPIPAPAPGISLDQYLPQLMSGRWHGILAAPSGAFSSEWFSEPGRMRWGDSVEHWRVRDCNGQSYAWVDAYESLTAKAVYPIETVIDGVGGNDLSSCKDGAAFAPMHIVGDVITEQWFRIWDATHTYWRPGYWRGEFKPVTVANPCQAGRTLPAIELREVWWDSAGGWVRGHPKDAGKLPWVGDNTNPVAWASGQPVPIQVVSDSVETFALGSGLWTITEGGGMVCQASINSW